MIGSELRIPDDCGTMLFGLAIFAANRRASSIFSTLARSRNRASLPRERVRPSNHGTKGRLSNGLVKLHGPKRGGKPRRYLTIGVCDE